MSSLPSLHALRAFEAAARLGRFKLAAAELHLSPTAVSHHIRQLERDLGVQLFSRGYRRVSLTPAGERLLGVCEPAFRGIEACVDELRATGSRHPVTLGLGPMLAARWLIPRLSRLWASFPELDVRLLHNPVAEPGTDEPDVLIAWGDGDWPDRDAEILLRIATVPVGAPALVERHGPPESLEALATWPLVHQRDERAWRDWFDRQGETEVVLNAAMVIEDANVALQAAIDGQGALLGFPAFIGPELESGQLVPLWSAQVASERAYYLVRRAGARDDPDVAHLTQWLLAEAAAT